MPNCKALHYAAFRVTFSHLPIPKRACTTSVMQALLQFCGGTGHHSGLSANALTVHRQTLVALPAYPAMVARPAFAERPSPLGLFATVILLKSISVLVALIGLVMFGSDLRPLMGFQHGEMRVALQRGMYAREIHAIK